MGSSVLYLNQTIVLHEINIVRPAFLLPCRYDAGSIHYRHLENHR